MSMSPEYIDHYEVDNYEDIICPVCGYYCLGNGGYGCIDKLGFKPKEQTDETE